MSKLAVVGSGISGVLAAYLLSKTHQVTLYEAQSRLGGHTHTVHVQDPQLGNVGIDTGFIVFNTLNYPIFTRFLDELKVPSQPSDMSFGYYLKHPEFWYCSDFPSGIFSQKKNVVSLRMFRLIADIHRFNRQVTDHYHQHNLSGLTLGQYVSTYRYSDFFLRSYLLPMCAAIWSSDYDAILEFPMQSLVAFWMNHRLLQFFNRPVWRTVQGGSMSYLTAFQSQFSGQIKRNAAVEKVVATQEGVRVIETSGAEDHFDQVVIATHADQALAMRDNPTELETALLGAWRYSSHDVILHSDARLLPPARSGWASWTAYQCAQEDKRLRLTYVMNRLQKLETQTPYLVTLNPQDGEIDPLLIHKKCRYQHPIFDSGSIATQSQLPELNKNGKLFYCGSYFGYGFHEDGAKSALAVANALGVSWPQ